MTKEQVIKDLLELVGPDAKKKDFQEISEEIFNEALKKLLEKKDPENVDHIKNNLDKIFEICPKCNFIPLAYEYQDYTDLITAKNCDEIQDFICDLISEESPSYITPIENDDMKIGDAKEMYRLWKECIEKCNIQEGTDKGVCDYSENAHYSVYGYFKETGKIKQVFFD